MVQNTVAFFPEGVTVLAKQTIHEICNVQQAPRNSQMSSTSMLKTSLIFSWVRRGSCCAPNVCNEFSQLDASKRFWSRCPSAYHARVEVSVLRLEVNETQQFTQKESNFLEKVVNIAQDVSEEQTLIHDARGSNTFSTANYAAALTNSTSNRWSQLTHNTVNRDLNIPKQTNHYQQ